MLLKQCLLLCNNIINHANKNQNKNIKTKIEETFVEERTIIVEEGLQIEDSEPL